MPIATLSLTAVDCDDPVALAQFYAGITGGTVQADEVAPGEAGPEWVELVTDSGAVLAFQRVARHTPPQWPDGQPPQQMHLDFDVPDLDAGETAVLALGATKAAVQPGRTFRVFLDPAGHPFCLVRAQA